MWEQWEEQGSARRPGRPARKIRLSPGPRPCGEIHGPSRCSANWQHRSTAVGGDGLVDKKRGPEAQLQCQLRIRVKVARTPPGKIYDDRLVCTDASYMPPCCRIASTCQSARVPAGRGQHRGEAQQTKHRSGDAYLLRELVEPPLPGEEDRRGEHTLHELVARALVQPFHPFIPHDRQHAVDDRFVLQMSGLQSALHDAGDAVSICTQN